MVVQLVPNGNNMDEYISGCFVRLFLHFFCGIQRGCYLYDSSIGTRVIDSVYAVNWTRITRLLEQLRGWIHLFLWQLKVISLLVLCHWIGQRWANFFPIDFYIQRTSVVGRLIRNDFFFFN